MEGVVPADRAAPSHVFTRVPWVPWVPWVHLGHYFTCVPVHVCSTLCMYCLIYGEWPHRHYAGLLEEYSSPKEGSKKLQFKDKFPKPLPVQFTAIFTKYMAVYWRMPEYNGTRFFLALAVGFVFGAIFWRLGDKL